MKLTRNTKVKITIKMRIKKRKKPHLFIGIILTINHNREIRDYNIYISIFIYKKGKENTNTIKKRERELLI